MKVDRRSLLRSSKVFCLAPWTHLHVLTTGEVFPCCMSAHQPDNAVGRLKKGDTLESAWNSEKMRTLRRRMLSGEGSELCERCYETEAVGQLSWRLSANEEFAHHFDVVQTTDESGQVEKINLPYLDIRFSNVCNLRCRICGPKLSSSWYKDGLAMGWVAPSRSAVETASEAPEVLWEQIVPLLGRAEHFHFAGGEPLVSEEHYRILDELLRRKLHHVKLSYNTNFSRLQYRSRDILDLWRHFPNVYVQASLDGMGARGDYMRKGQVWDQIVRNRERARRECPHLDFVVLATVSIMNVLHMPDFYKEWVEKEYITPWGMQLNILFEPPLFNIRGLPLSFKERVREKYRDFIETYLGRLGEQGRSARTHFESVLLYMDAEDWDRLDEFRQYTIDLDVLRGERFRDVFPELADLVAPSAFVDLTHRGRSNSKFDRVELALRDFDGVIGELSAEPAEGRSADRTTILAQAYIERGRLKLGLGDVDDAQSDFGRAQEISMNALLRSSKVFCLAPWTHLHVLTTGEIFPCCMSAHQPDNAVGQLKKGDTLESAWNSEKMRTLRRRMLSGEGSELCERCYETEAVGQQSWRLSANQEFAHHFDVVQTTDESGRVEKINLPYLDIRFSNVCNLRCRICGPKLSSSWYKDGLAMGWVAPSRSAVETASEAPEVLWEQIVPLLGRAEHFHFAGGEPLVSEEHYRILDELLRRKLHQVKLSYNTNFSRLQYRSRDILDLWRHFPNVYVQASLDGMGARGDYMRKGQVWDQIVRNRERARRECPHLDFVVLATVSIMNVLHMPDFYKEWVEKEYITPWGMQLNILFEPLLFNIRGLPLSLKERVREKYRDFIETYLGRLGEQGRSARTYFESVLLYMDAEDWDRLDEFRQYTMDLDVLRGERFRDVFPELADLVAPSAFVDLTHRGRSN